MPQRGCFLHVSHTLEGVVGILLESRPLDLLDLGMERGLLVMKGQNFHTFELSRLSNNYSTETA